MTFWTKHKRTIVTVALAMLAAWGTVRAERVFNGAYNDYRDFQAMRAWIINVQQQQQGRK